MKKNNTLRLAALFSLPLLITACFGGSEVQKVRLEGKRIDVLINKTPLTVDPTAMDVPLNLPKPAHNLNWPQLGGTANHAPLHVALPQEVTPAWTKSIGNAKGITLNPPVIANGKLFVFNTKGRILALDAKTGDTIWKQNLDLREADLSAFTGGLAATNTHLFVTTATGEVLALSTEDGSELWRKDLAVPLRAAPTFFNGGLFVTSHDNRLFAMDAASGRTVWTHNGATETLGLMANASPAVAYGAVATAYSGGDLYLLKGNTGEYLWHDAFTATKGSLGNPFLGLNAITAPPVMADGIAYAVNVNGRLTAFHLQSGNRLWNVNLSASQMPWVAGFGVFVVTDSGELVALNRRDGAVRWLQDLNSFIKTENPTRTWVGPVLAGGRLIVASSDGYALSFAPNNGQKMLTAELMKNDGPIVPPIVADERLYFLTQSGKLIAFE